MKCTILPPASRVRAALPRRARAVTARAAEAASSPTEVKDVCKKCGVKLSDVPFGCDQDGHKVGGAGALFEWWPVKAWGPCEKLAEAGIPYTRKGQGTDEILFGQDKSKK